MPRAESLVAALRILAVLAVHPDGALTSEQLSEITGGSPVVIRRIVARLRLDGVVETRRGPGGGCALALDPGRIRLRRLYAAITERQPLAFDAGVLRCTLESAEAAYRRELDQWTLADVMDTVPGVDL